MVIFQHCSFFHNPLGWYNPERIRIMSFTFDRLLDIDCSCLAAQISECSENTEATFCRAVKRKAHSREFGCKWDSVKKKGRIDDVLTNRDCDEIISYKGVSVDLFDENNREEVLKKYRTTYNFNRRKDKYVVFKFCKGAGKIRHSPEFGGSSHHDFFKSDDFSMEQHIAQIGIHPIFGGPDVG